MSKPSAGELVKLAYVREAGVVLAARVEKVLALPHPKGGNLIAIAGWDACYADVLRLLNGKDP